MSHTSPIIGHASQRLELQTDLETGNIAHGYLFAGPPHVGKTTIAKWFARELLLRDVPASERARAEEEMEKLIHPDFLILDDLWIEDVREDWGVIAQSSNLPQQHRAKAPAMKTDVIGIDDVRVIQERLYETGRGHWRCCLIRGIERMREEAANAFLKILEEPPPGRVFLLTAESLNVLPTIISRSRVLRFERVSNADMRPILDGIDEDDARFILHFAQGAPGLVRRLHADPEALRRERQLHDHALSVWSASSLGERLKLLKPLADRGEEANKFLLHLALTLREHPMPPEVTRSFTELIQALRTNAHREILVQRFAMGMAG